MGLVWVGKTVEWGEERLFLSCCAVVCVCGRTARSVSSTVCCYAERFALGVCSTRSCSPAHVMAALTRCVLEAQEGARVYTPHCPPRKSHGGVEAAHRRGH